MSNVPAASALPASARLPSSEDSIYERLPPCNNCHSSQVPFASERSKSFWKVMLGNMAGFETVSAHGGTAKAAT